MPRLPAWLESYRTLPKCVLLFVAGQFLINLINSSQFLLLNLFLKARGLDDPSIAALTSHRFLATFFLALPAGLWLRGKPLRKPLIIGSVLFPLTALASLETVRHGHMTAASACFVAMGFANLILNVANLPMMLRMAPPKQSSEALSLLFAMWGAASICGGVLSSVLQGMGHLDMGKWHFVFDEHTTLLVLTITGLAAPFFYVTLPDPVPATISKRHWLHVHREDFPVLLRALLPTLCIATGAGLSIQFLNLFFSSVYHLSSATYSAYGSVSYVLVFVFGLIVPEVRRRLGWRGAILGVQSAAVVMLALMGLTELWKHTVWALPMALVCFIFRQPLMNMAGPSTSELSMTYVGERNRELMSACNGAIWSGAWWLAARVFEIFRTHDLPYWQIFLTTAVFYLFGTVSYLGLIRSVEKRELEDAVAEVSPEQGQV
ncbi:MAG: MFS transporter [Luteolibacter sp.]|uniref:MFS transporter n=1 Tax=Luteolibacter sp. TaxID=1962973 RepID=UPI0032677A77